MNGELTLNKQLSHPKKKKFPLQLEIEINSSITTFCAQLNSIATKEVKQNYSSEKFIKKTIHVKNSLKDHPRKNSFKNHSCAPSRAYQLSKEKVLASGFDLFG